MHNLALVHANNMSVVLQPSMKANGHQLPFTMRTRIFRSCFHSLYVPHNSERLSVSVSSFVSLLVVLRRVSRLVDEVSGFRGCIAASVSVRQWVDFSKERLTRLSSVAERRLFSTVGKHDPTLAV